MAPVEAKVQLWKHSLGRRVIGMAGNHTRRKPQTVKRAAQKPSPGGCQTDLRDCSHSRTRLPHACLDVEPQ